MPNGLSKIPLYGISRQYLNLREEIRDVSDQVYLSGQLLDGEQTRKFEAAIAARTGRKYAIAVNSGTQAIVFTLMHYRRVLSHRTILLPSVSFAATVNAPVLTDYKLSFADVDHHGLMSINSPSMRDEDISLLMYVNLCGNMVDYHKLLVATRFFSSRPSIPIIEDAAQSFGASFDGVPSGKAGDVSILSFDPTKNLPNYGSGGMVLTDDPEVADSIALYRNNGKLSNHAEAGTNSKMSEVDCAQMLVKLKYFDEWQLRRAQIAKYYTNALNGAVETPYAAPGVTHAWSKYTIKTSKHNKFGQQKLAVAAFAERGIIVKPTYSDILPELAVSNQKDGLFFPVATDYCKRGINLPIYPEMTDSEVEHVAKAMADHYTSF